ncbi:MAG: hypothetical protein WD733_14515 [Bryobacterales bacterium]
MTLNGIATDALSTALAEVGTAARRVSQATTPAVDPEPRLELTTELVRLLRAQRHLVVAVEIARTADETTQTTLDLLR